MSVRRILVGALTALVSAGIGWVAVGGTSRPPEPPTPSLPHRGNGITIARVPAGGLSGSEMAQAAADDYWVQNGRLSFVIGGGTQGAERLARRGNLLDLGLSDFGGDELVELRVVARVGGKPVSFDPGTITLVTDRKYPFLRVEQVSHDRALRLATEFRAAPNGASIELVTRLHNTGQQLIRSVELGERTRWPGAPTFAPRVGFPRLTSRAEVSWLARQGAKLSYALAFPRGPVEAQFLFDRIGPVGQETLARLGDAPPDSVVEYRRVLVVVPGDLGNAAEVAFRALGRAVGRVQGRLDPAPAWAVIEARYPDGKPALSVRADVQGRYVLPLPEGDYRLVLHSPGGDDEQEVSVDAKQPLVAPRFIAPEPGRFKYLVNDADGAALPARIILRGVPPTRDPDLSPLEQAGGAKNIVYTRTGQGEIELPAGRYRVVVTHGPEYDIVDQEVEVNAESGASVHATLARTVETGGWIACDFHLHAAPSHDSSVTLEDRVLSLLAEGVEYAVPTDHNHVTDYQPIVARLGATALLATTSGVEITTATWGHFNAFPYPRRLEPPPWANVAPAEIFAVVRARAPGAVIQVNHPRMPGVGYFNRIELRPELGSAEADDASFDFDAIEVVNGYDLEAPKLIEQNLREYFSLLNFGRRYTATGSSDSHRLVINWAGYPRSYVRVADDAPEKVRATEIARAVAEGRVVVSNGIFIAVAANGTQGPGDTIVGRRVTLEIDARAPRWVDVRRIAVWVSGTLATTFSGARRAGNAPLHVKTELDVEQDGWIVVEAWGEQPMSPVFYGRRVLPFAFTNPIFVDADQDGVVRPAELPAPRAERELP